MGRLAAPSSRLPLKGETTLRIWAQASWGCQTYSSPVSDPALQPTYISSPAERWIEFSDPVLLKFAERHSNQNKFLHRAARCSNHYPPTRDAYANNRRRQFRLVGSLAQLVAPTAEKLAIRRSRLATAGRRHLLVQDELPETSVPQPEQSDRSTSLAQSQSI